MAVIPAVLKPQWLRTYAAVILAVGVAVNLVVGFSQYVQALTVPGMKAGFALSYTETFALVASLFLARMITAAVAGALASRYGGRWMLIGSLLASAAAMTLLGWSPNYWVALLAMIVIGGASASALVPMMGMLLPWFRVSDRGTATGIATAGGSLAIILTGILTPPLDRFFGGEAWRYIWYILAGISLAGGLLAWGYLRDAPASAPGRPAARRPDRPRSDRARQAGWPAAVYTNPYVWLVTAMAICSGFVQGIFTSSYGAYLGVEHNVAVDTLGGLFAAIGILGIASTIVPGALSDRMGRGLVYAGVFLMQAGSYLLFWLLPDLAMFVLASILTGLTLRSAIALCAAAAGDFVPPAMTAAAFGLIGMGASIGTTISPLIAGPVADATQTLQWAFAIGAGVALLGAALGAILQLKTPRRAAEG